VNKEDYNMVQQGAAPQLQDLYALKDQMMRTLKVFTVMLGATNSFVLALES
jgi:hypothetical protein